MHTKGMDQQTLDIALATGMPVNCFAKILGRAHGHAVSPGPFASWRCPA